MSEQKHAYLIMAHGHFSVLEKLLIMLDDVRNDIYLHIDKKAGEAPHELLCKAVSKGTLVFVKPMSVFWGGSSQVECELLLLQACMASGNNYAFVHLISGVDLPLKSQDEIHAFFDDHPDTQFLQVGDASNHLYRINRYHILRNGNHEKLQNRLEPYIEILQHKFRIDRLKKYGDIKVVKTANWFSLTGDCAKYVLSKKAFIRRLTRCSICADEMFLGTVIADSPYWEQVYKKEFSWDGHMRYIDRIRNVGPSPHTFTLDDMELLDASDMLFARKFDDTVDGDIIDYLFRKITAPEEQNNEQ